MKKKRFAVFSAILLASMLSCAYTSASQPIVPASQIVTPASQARVEPLIIDGLDITARGAFGRMEAALLGPMYAGDGGRNISLAVLAPDVQGDVPDFLPLYIQGMLNNNINRFSAINLIDRQHLNRIIADQDLALDGRFSDEDFIRIGQIANARYLLLGTIHRLSGNQFSLQLSITEAIGGIVRATFMQNGTLAQLEGRGTLLNEATAKLLGQMGVQFTEAGMQTLLAGNISMVQAEAGLARGILAQAGGNEVAALLNFAQAVSFDPRQLEAAARLDTLSTTISGRTVSESILNEMQLWDQWVEAFRETTRFFNAHPPFEIIFDPSLIQIGEIDFTRRTATLGMRIALDPSEAGFGALNALLEGLERTGRRGAWGFSGWPLTDIGVAGTVVFGGRRSFSYRVDVALVNENGLTVGRSNITLNTEPIGFSAGDGAIAPPFSVEGLVTFPDVRADDLTPTLTIVILAVNGIRTHELSTAGYMRIEPGYAIRDNPHGNTYSVNSVVFSPDGRQVVSAGIREYSYFDSSGVLNIWEFGSIKLWDAVTGREVMRFTGHTRSVNSVVFSPDGRQIVSVSWDETIRLWDVATGQEIWQFPGLTRMGDSMAFSSDGMQVVWGSSDGTIRLLDVATGQESRRFTGHTDGVSSVAFSPDGMQVVFGSHDGTIMLWDVATGQEIRRFTGHTESVGSVAFNPDGTQVVSGSWDSTVRFWDVATGRENRRFTGHTDGVSSVAFSPDGMQVVSGCSRGRTIMHWDVATGQEIRRFTGHTNAVRVAFSPDGMQIVSGSWDRTIRFWEVDTGRLIRTVGSPR